MTKQGRAKSGLRVLVDPFVVAPPRGVRTRTRVRLTGGEEAAIERIGVFLGGQYRAALADRIALGAVTGKEQADWHRERKNALTAGASSRWAGAITRTAMDSYDLGMRGLAAYIDSLMAAICAIAARLAVPVGGEVRDPDRPRAKPIKGYRTEAERFQKSRRKAQLEARLAEALRRRETGRPRIVVGGGRLWRNRQNLDQAGLTRAQWESRWTDERMFLTADGESGKKYGNETIRVTADGILDIKVPAALASHARQRLTITAAVSLSTHRGDEWADRIATRKRVRYDLHRDHRGRWYLDASWSYGDEVPAVPLTVLQTQHTLGVDLNDGHLGVAVIDAHPRQPHRHTATSRLQHHRQDRAS